MPTKTPEYSKVAQMLNQVDLISVTAEKASLRSVNTGQRSTLKYIEDSQSNKQRRRTPLVCLCSEVENFARDRYEAS